MSKKTLKAQVAMMQRQKLADLETKIAERTETLRELEELAVLKATENLAPTPPPAPAPVTKLAEFRALRGQLDPISNVAHLVENQMDILAELDRERGFGPKGAA
jgi:hypothetical protein